MPRSQNSSIEHTQSSFSAWAVSSPSYLDHPGHRRESIADLDELRDLVGVFAEHDLRSGVVSDVLAFLGQVRGIDGDRGGAGGDDSEVDGDPLQARLSQDAHPIAGLDAGGDQCSADLPRIDPHRVPGDLGVAAIAV